jgi:NAD(P)H-hydrate epimerase
MRRIDSVSINEMGLPGTVLMGFAGKKVFDLVAGEFGSAVRICVLCGSGNNGGDGLVAAHFLRNSGRDVRVCIAGDRNRLSPDTAVYLGLCEKTGLAVTVLDDSGLDSLDLAGTDLIIDALLGTGASGQPMGLIGRLIDKINVSGIPVLSVDMPSGLPSDGAVPSMAVKASATLTIGLPKINLVTFPGKKFAGRIFVADIGFPAVLLDSDDIRVELVDGAYCTAHLKADDDPDSHKSSRGHLLLVGGFYGMEGAIILAASAALETGLGLISILTRKESRDVIAGTRPEAITHGIGESEDPDSIKEELDRFFSGRRIDAIVMGPGMGRGRFPSIVFGTIMDNLRTYGIKRAVIDGDGLFLLAGYLAEKKPDYGAGVIITPHFLEASRILNITVDEIKLDRIGSAKSLAGLASCVVLLKGPATIVSDGDYSLVNTSGNSSLATGGSGDVLSGITGALMLRDQSLLSCAGMAAYIHGRAADLFAEESGSRYMKAGDIVQYVKSAMAFGLQSGAIRTI